MSATNTNGENCLHLSAAGGYHNICKLLLNRTAFGNVADVFLVDNDGKSAIDKAIESGFKELASSFALFAAIDSRYKVSYIF